MFLSSYLAFEYEDDENDEIDNYDDLALQENDEDNDEIADEELAEGN